jgi:hypothetical protein
LSIPYLFQFLQQRIEELALGLIVDQAGAELAQDARVETIILQRQMQGIFPIDPRPHHPQCDPVTQMFHRLPHRHQAQPRRAIGRLSGVGIH